MPNNWPDPERPGVPLNEKVSGYHWIQRMDVADCKPVIWEWDAGSEWWRFHLGVRKPEELEGKFLYVAPCLPPSNSWQPISTATKDAIVELTDGGWLCTGVCQNGQWYSGWLSGDALFRIRLDPTHWRALSAPPPAEVVP